MNNRLTTKIDISNWVRNGWGRGYTHLIIVCDTFNYEDYPVYVSSNEKITEIIDKYNKNMQKVIEVYSYSLNLNSQLAERRAYHL